MLRELQLVVGGRRRAVSSPSGSFRLRPGERPVWIELDPDEEETHVWRRRAGELGLSVDVWLAVQTEWEIVRRDLTEEAVIEALLRRARFLVEVPALAPTDELRAWVGWLTAALPEAAEHDLPSVVLPARIVARLQPAALVASVRDAATSGREKEALVIERAASFVGMTMEAWAYRELARLTA
jgi:hypothetical protein